MKKLVLIFVCLMFITTFAYAETKVTSEKWCHTHNYEDSDTIIDDTQRNPIEAGLGADIKVLDLTKNPFLDSLNVEVRKDLVDMERVSAYVVLKIDLTK